MRIALTIRTFFMVASGRWISGWVLWLPERNSGHSLIMLMHIDQDHHYIGS
jgi:hypothetical protein